MFSAGFIFRLPLGVRLAILARDTAADDTFEAAVANAAEALAGHFAAMKADGEAAVIASCNIALCNLILDSVTQ